ncbi:MAG: hypothetical protein ACREM9_15390 [Gemmatimonadales bacterium]
MVAALLATPLKPALAVQAPDTSVAHARQAFDFLIGSWRVASRISGDSVIESSGETYRFKKALDGVVIDGFWRFNRGSPDQPDWTDAVYYSAFDPTSLTWSFYYISPRSAQYWPGRKSGGRWYFSQTFTLDGKAMLQRQWWEPVNDSTVHRHIDNSSDGGATWTPFTVVLRRQTR